MAQTEFDRQAEVTRLLLEGISSTHVSPTFLFRRVLPQAEATDWASHPRPVLSRVWSVRVQMGTGHAEARG